MLEYKGALSLAFSYCIYDFIYCPQTYTIFNNPKPVEEYISKDNDLLITGSLDSQYHSDYMSFINSIVDEYNFFEIVKFDSEMRFDLKVLKAEYLDKGIPIAFPCDHYYLYEEYRKKSSNLLHYHTGWHTAILLDININNGTCYVVDKFFSYIGNISIENYLFATKSDYIKTPICFTVNNTGLVNLSEEERVRYLFKNAIKNSLTDNIIINNTVYYKNLKALQLLIVNFENHLLDLMNQKEKYAPQFTTKLLKQVRLNKKGFNHLINYANKYLKCKHIEDLEYKYLDAVNLWTSIDQLCDKCYLQGNYIIDYKDRLIKILNNIYETEKYIFDSLVKIEQMI